MESGLNVQPSSARVLVVEDTLEIRELLAEILGAEGYQVTTASEGGEGLRALDREHVDLVLLDLMMPVMDGFEFLGHLAERGDAPPVIAMSAFERFRDQACAAGARSFLGKPVDIDRLLHEIEQTLQERAEAQAAAHSTASEASGARAAERERGAPLDGWLLGTAAWLASVFDLDAAAVQLRLPGGRTTELLAGDTADPAARALAQRLGAVARQLPGPLVVPDAQALLGAQTPGPRFQVAIPLRSVRAESPGALVAWDAQPRALHGAEVCVLEILARLVGQALTQEARGLPAGSDGVNPAAGLWGRELTQWLLEAECHRARRERGPLAVALVRFDAGAGDALEQRLRLLREPFGSDVLVGQRRANELALVTRAASPWAVELLRSLDRLCASWLDEGPHRAVVGIASSEAGAEPTADELLALADLALDRAEARQGCTEHLVLPAAQGGLHETH